MELYLDGSFTKDRAVLTQELQRHCKEENTTMRGRRPCRFMEEWRIVELTVDVVLQASSKVAEEKVIVPEDVSRDANDQTATQGDDF